MRNVIRLMLRTFNFMIGNYYQLYRTTKTQIADARAEARAGRKDFAREIFRFITNAKILPLITAYEYPAALCVDAALLRWELSQLETECHPQAPCDQGGQKPAPQRDPVASNCEPRDNQVIHGCYA